jgi:D-tyrosyl-tRNA(Tyr) deacylase
VRAVAQRVSSASVVVDGEVVGEIGIGFVLLVGVARHDTAADAAALADKIAGLRVFADADRRMNLPAGEVGGAVLVISQFTLHGDVRKGRRPSFTAAAPPEVAEPLVDAVAERLRANGLTVATGRFGAYMEVDLVNDGPVTVIVETAGGKVV